MLPHSKNVWGSERRNHSSSGPNCNSTRPAQIWPYACVPDPALPLPQAGSLASNAPAGPPLPPLPPPTFAAARALEAAAARATSCRRRASSRSTQYTATSNRNFSNHSREIASFMYATAAACCVTCHAFFRGESFSSDAQQASMPSRSGFECLASETAEGAEVVVPGEAVAVAVALAVAVVVTVALVVVVKPPAVAVVVTVAVVVKPPTVTVAVAVVVVVTVSVGATRHNLRPSTLLKFARRSCSLTSLPSMPPLMSPRSKAARRSGGTLVLGRPCSSRYLRFMTRKASRCAVHQLCGVSTASPSALLRK
mmetsp:Transcript_35974/g.86245  ORF Transcript_35974/g.86245 Transcript_35974/m.86245 type:complete len:310 (-) Transcript_35974:168-1097(-)